MQEARTAGGGTGIVPSAWVSSARRRRAVSLSRARSCAASMPLLRMTLVMISSSSKSSSVGSIIVIFHPVIAILTSWRDPLAAMIDRQH
jgi:hypothetical protein